MIGVIGAGAFGTALAAHLSLTGRKVILWGRDGETINHIHTTHMSPKFLGDITLPTDLPVTTNFDELRLCDLLLLAIPVQTTPQFIANQNLPEHVPIVLCSKGIETYSTKLPHELLQDHNAPTLLLSGPGFAVDLARGLPTAMSLACANDGLLQEVQEKLSTKALRLYRSNDMIGVGLCGALKNIYAIGAGAVMGAGLGESARAAFLTRSFSELSRFIASQGGNLETCYGLAGMGDLMLTSGTDKSRNFRYGYALGQNEQFAEDVTVEGKPTLSALLKKAKAADIELPIAQEIKALVDKETSIPDILSKLMTRELRSEI